MGLFSQRPEEPTEWAGIPSEPSRPQTAAEHLADAAPVEDALLGAGTGGVESIVIPVAPMIEIARPHVRGEDEETLRGHS